MSAPPRGSASQERELLTTGQAAALCAVDPKTIARWADAGLVPTHRTVGGRRRMQRADLLAFMRRQGMPVPSGRAAPRVVIVDDEPIVVRSLERILARAFPGARLRGAYNGFEAGLLVAAEQPDLVLLDVVMPGLSGVEVCAALRAMPSLGHTRVVVVSGHLGPETRRKLSAVGADAFVPKPFSPESLLEVVRPLVASLRHVAAGAPR
ncbi:MAG: response regulator [Sandaracinaceae bacterium]|nr:response regulator [Sandaracinaceae bacterium]